MLKNIKIVWCSQLLITHLNAFFGIFQASSIWEDGKLDNQDRDKSMDKGYKSFLINIFIKVSSSMAKKMVPAFLNWLTEIYMMGSGSKDSKMEEEFISILQPESSIAENGDRAKKMDKVI